MLKFIETVVEKTVQMAYEEGMRLEDTPEVVIDKAETKARELDARLPNKPHQKAVEIWHTWPRKAQVKFIKTFM